MSNYLKGMIKTLWDAMKFNDGKVLGVFLWTFLPVVVGTVLGWVLADLILELDDD